MDTRHVLSWVGNCFRGWGKICMCRQVGRLRVSAGHMSEAILGLIAS